MATPDTDRLFSEFVDAWNAGERPDAEDFLARAGEAGRDDLTELISTFLEHAPTPSYSDTTLAELMREPALEAAARAIEGQSGLWPILLRRLRDRARLRRADVVQRLADELGASGKEQKVASYYHQMERGLLPAGGVSSRVLEALSRILGESVQALREAGRVVAPGAMQEEPAVVFARLAQPAAEFAEASSAEPGEAPAEAEWDEIDELFRGSGEDGDGEGQDPPGAQ